MTGSNDIFVVNRANSTVIKRHGKINKVTFENLQLKTGNRAIEGAL